MYEYIDNFVEKININNKIHIYYNNILFYKIILNIEYITNNYID